MWLLFLLHLQRTALCIYPGKAVEGSVTRNSKHWERREKRDLKKCRRFISDGNAMCVWQRTHAGLIVATWFNAAALSCSSCGWRPFHICSSPWSQGTWTALVAVCPYNLIGQHQKYWCQTLCGACATDTWLRVFLFETGSHLCSRSYPKTHDVKPGWSGRRACLWVMGLKEPHWSWLGFLYYGHLVFMVGSKGRWWCWVLNHSPQKFLRCPATSWLPQSCSRTLWAEGALMLMGIFSYYSFWY